MIKKTFPLLIFLLVSLLGCQARRIDPYYTKGKQKRLFPLTIVAFADEISPQRGIKLTADLRKALANNRKIPLVEPQLLSKALRDTRILSPAYLEPAVARRLGKETKTDLVLTGRITDFYLDEKVINVPLLWTTTIYTATYKMQINLVRTFSNRQYLSVVEGKAELKRRAIQLLYLGGESNFQLIAAEEKQRLIKKAYDNLIENLVKVITS